MLFMSPLLLPALAFGFAALVFVYQLGLRPRVPLLVLGPAVLCVPFVLRTPLASLTQLDSALLDASASLGADRIMTFRRVTRSEEHTSELQSHLNLVCRLLLE